MSKDTDTKRDGVILFQQSFLESRVIETEDIDGSPEWVIEFAMLGGPSHMFTFHDELQAKGAYKTLEEAMLKHLRVYFDKMVEIHDEVNPAPLYDAQLPTEKREED